MSDDTGGAGPPAPPVATQPDRRDRGLIAKLAALVLNVRVLRVSGQVLALGLLLFLAIYLQDNYQANIRSQNLNTGWGFLDEPTGFDIEHSDFRSGQPMREAIWYGIRNTAAAAAIGMVLSTVLGVLIGVIRLSQSWVARKAATLYVETLRNIPVLLIILFAASIIRTLPQIQEAREISSFAIISNRGLTIASPVTDSGFSGYLLLLAIGAVAAWLLAVWRVRVSQRTGAPHHRVVWAGGLFLGVAIAGYAVFSGPVSWSRPELLESSTSGGFLLTPAYAAVTFALGIYHASHIAEIVRGSIQAVPHGQAEAATAIGLNAFQRMRYVVLPQALRIAVPPTINQHLSLTKNTSLGAAVAYSDITKLGGQMISSSGAPALFVIVMLMAIYLVFSLVTSLLLNLFNRRVQLVER